VSAGTAAAPRWRAWRSFAGSSPVTQAFLGARLMVLPLAALEDDLLGLRGRVLSLGSGFGVIERYLAEINPHVTIDGYELDAERVALAGRTQARAPRVEIHEADVTTLEAGEGYDAAIAIDVLHHIPAQEHPAIAASLARALKPGGRCLVKDVGVAPSWKHAFNRAHDRLVAGPDPTFCRAPDDMAAVFAGAGFAVGEVVDLGRRSPYPHYLLRLRRAG
jgi:2-polyprenyl-6-hydroxyphenyl methylase/3-demethylubiquinone-9 3-methyltransferase